MTTTGITDVEWLDAKVVELSAKNEIFNGLKAVVQYRRKDEGIQWRTMAAFDSRTMADKYVADCSRDGDRPWEYRAVDVPVGEN